jgi:DNA polymerase II large subunit
MTSRCASLTSHRAVLTGSVCHPTLRSYSVRLVETTNTVMILSQLLQGTEEEESKIKTEMDEQRPSRSERATRMIEGSISRHYELVDHYHSIHDTQSVIASCSLRLFSRCVVCCV